MAPVPSGSKSSVFSMYKLYYSQVCIGPTKGLALSWAPDLQGYLTGPPTTTPGGGRSCLQFIDGETEVNKGA